MHSRELRWRTRLNRSTETPRDRYERWWLGKLCRASSLEPYRKVKRIELVGPPSFVYGDVWLEFDDGEKVCVPHHGMKPTKADVDVCEEETRSAT